MCVKVIYLGSSKIICKFDMFSDIDEKVILFSSTYGSKPFLELYNSVRKTSAEGSAK